MNPDVPEWLAEIIEKLHEKNPADRFQTAAEVADLLERHLAHLQQPTVVPQPGRLTQAEKGITPLQRSDRRWVLLAGAIALGLAIAAAASIRNFLLQTAGVRPDPRGNDQSQQASDSGSGPSSTVTGAVPASAPSETASLSGSGIPSAENVAIEADIRQLQSELQRIAPYFFPRELEVRVGERSPEMIAVEQRLDRLEEELRANPLSERNKK